MLHGKKISMIAAATKNLVIGAGNRIPWKLVGEQRRFRELTLGGLVIMGRRTFQSIGRALPGRDTIVITRSSEFRAPDSLIAHSLEEVSELVVADGREEAFIAGGEEIYRMFLPFADVVYLTEIDLLVDGDAFFPEISTDEFRCVERRHVPGVPSYDYVTYVRTNTPSGS